LEKVDHIIRADHVLTMEGGQDVIPDGAVAVSGSIIRDVGTFSDISGKYSSEKVSEGRNRLVFPGFVNTHTHAPMVYFRGLADDLPLHEWLEKHIWPAETKWLTEEFVSDSVELACLEMLKAGVTTYTDQYFYQDTAGRKIEKIGMRGVLGAGIIDFPSLYAKSPDDYFRNAEALITNWKGNDLISPSIAPHAIYTCGPDNYKRAKEMADRYDVPLHTHLAETEFEVSESIKRYGKRPVEYLESIGVLSDRFIAAHCVWVTDREIDLLAKYRVGVSHCIESNLKLASGIAPVPKMISAGIRVGLGTDGAASNNDLNILGEMQTAAKVHKAISKDPTVIDCRTALAMATVNGAEILGLGNKTGSLRPGKAADLVIADIGKPHLTPIYDIHSLIVYSMRPSDIESVMVNGKTVVDNGKLVTGDEASIMQKAREWQKKIRS
jgi:5-methylthioadenosine/S-adenosylhomocysteine deaminase